MLQAEELWDGDDVLLLQAQLPLEDAAVHMDTLLRGVGAGREGAQAQPRGAGLGGDCRQGAGPLQRGSVQTPGLSG